ncbi:MAG TPA: hypothetical protein VFB87_10530 [Gaiellaceae bacterium]|jgi:hypothetical protein|nr:hypothetical protein [Gaiellaceae bacterium]
MSTTDRGGPMMIGLGVLIVGFIIGIVLLAMDFVLIGILVACLAIPAALVAWMTAGDRV